VARFGRLLSIARRYLEEVTAIARQVDASGWPLVLVTPPRFASDESLRGLTDDLAKLLDRKERFCTLMNYAGRTCMELREVRYLTDFFVEHGERMDVWVAALGLVVPSAMVRGGLRVVFRARTPGYPYELFETQRKAKAYLERQLAELTMPTAVGH